MEIIITFFFNLMAPFMAPTLSSLSCHQFWEYFLCVAHTPSFPESFSGDSVTYNQQSLFHLPAKYSVQKKGQV